MRTRYLLLLTITLLLASCSSGGGTNQSSKNDVGSMINLRTQGDAQVFKTRHWSTDGQIWIPVDRTASLLNYRYAMNAASKTAVMGFSDPMYTLTENSKVATIGDSTIVLREAPRMIDRMLCLEIGSLSQLLQTPVHWDASSHSVIVAPQKSAEPLQHTNGNLVVPGSDGLRAESVGANTAQADEVISFAKQFMHVPYLFSAGPYEQSHKFDCSSFMQYIFGHVGIHLPRSSMAQSTVGKYVTRNNLVAGDIVFFYTPGRYSSNDVVGHVGLYIGNNQVIQTYGKPGVTISSLVGDWDKRFMWGRRVW